jgi:hypothetical protein
MTTARTLTLVRAACAGLLLLASAAAQAGCWAAEVREPITNDGLPIGHASFAPLHRVMDQLGTMARSNEGLNALPEVRLRLRREIGDAESPSRQPREASLHAHGFGPKAWGRGDCEVIPQADRLGARAGISFFINRPFARLQPYAEDEQLTAYLEGERSEPMQGWPVYAGCAVLTANRSVWWLPVSVGEMLAFREREQQRRLDDYDRRNQRHAANAEFMAFLAKNRLVLQAELDKIKAFRTGLSPEAAGEPYRLGSGPFRLPTASEANKPLKRIVKLDPAWGWDGKNRTRVQAIHVCPSLLDRNPDYGPPMRQAVQGLDFARIAALLN